MKKQAISNTCTAFSNLSSRVLLLAAIASGGLFAGDAFAQKSSAAPLSEQQRQITEQRSGDWTLRCLPLEMQAVDKERRPVCELAQSVQIEQQGRKVEVLSLAISRAHDKAGKAKWALVVLAPLDVHLPSDLGLGIGTAKPTLTRYRNCNGMGCFALIPLDEAQMNRLKRANEGAIFFRLLNQRAVKVLFSLHGFSAGFADLASGKMPDSTSTQGIANKDEGKK